MNSRPARSTCRGVAGSRSRSWSMFFGRATRGDHALASPDLANYSTRNYRSFRAATAWSGRPRGRAERGGHPEPCGPRTARGTEKPIASRCGRLKFDISVMNARGPVAVVVHQSHDVARVVAGVVRTARDEELRVHELTAF